ncbi:hypothetical protein JCM19237_1928 [Photobacterium aphoticum]|uniref:Uncharacterized protein n=1 Tax=Photobacterium aphoticum TaxID=754436 RepID=A0A090QVI7_9GAMM|nr:hypothetical protein JCM19237_1928 [Photobacterium aphoticum]
MYDTQRLSIIQLWIMNNVVMMILLMVMIRQRTATVFTHNYSKHILFIGFLISVTFKENSLLTF